MEERLQDISIKINILDSLSRILLEIIRNGDNLKSFDSANLALVVHKNIQDIKEELNTLEINFHYE